MRARRFDFIEGLAATLGNAIIGPLMAALTVPARATYLGIGHAMATAGLFVMIGISVYGIADAAAYYGVNAPLAEKRASLTAWEISAMAADYRAKVEAGTYVEPEWTMLGLALVDGNVELEAPAMAGAKELRAQISAWGGGPESQTLLRSWPIEAGADRFKVSLPVAELPSGTTRASFVLKQILENGAAVKLAGTRAIEIEPVGG